MAESSNPLKVMFVFEAGARLHCGAEVICLATHLYHRFFRSHHDITQYDMYIFGSACIKLAHWYYEKPLDLDHLALVLNSIQNGTQKSITKSDKRKLTHSIEFAANIILVNLNFEISYKDHRMITPGEISATSSSRLAGPYELRLNQEEPESVYEDDYAEDVDAVDMDAKLLTKNSRFQISSQRYLLHYLATIQQLVSDDMMQEFKRVCNIAWALVSDAHWVPRVTQQYTNHIACICLMMAVEIVKPEYLGDKKSVGKRAFGTLLDKKWNLIFCDDLEDEKFRRLRNLMIRDYAEYERLLQHQFSTHVIDPKTSERRRSQGIL